MLRRTKADRGLPLALHRNAEECLSAETGCALEDTRMRESTIVRMDANALVIWGSSGHARVVAEAARATGHWQIVGFVDDVNLDRRGNAFCGAIVLGSREVLPDLRRRGVRQLFIGFGQNHARLRLARELEQQGFEFPVLVHPTATVASDARLGAGVFIGPGAVVSADVWLGEQTIVNSGAIVEHESRIADGVHLCPRSCLAGAVIVGEASWVGAGAVVRDKLTVGRDAVIGMGAVVTRSVPDGCVVYGCPARVVRRTAL